MNNCIYAGTKYKLRKLKHKTKQTPRKGSSVNSEISKVRKIKKNKSIYIFMFSSEVCFFRSLFSKFFRNLVFPEVVFPEFDFFPKDLIFEVVFPKFVFRSCFFFRRFYLSKFVIAPNIVSKI